MPLPQLRNVNLGRSCSNATGSSGVGYTLLDVTGSVTSPRTTSGVIQLAPGIYSAYVTFPDNFRGQILWDTGTSFPTASYAVEGYNYEENNPIVGDIFTQTSQILTTVDSITDTVNFISGTVSEISGTLVTVGTDLTYIKNKANQLYDIQYGRWKIEDNKMKFYKEDNSTLVAEFNLFDDAGNPTMDSVFDRVKV